MARVTNGMITYDDANYMIANNGFTRLISQINGSKTLTRTNLLAYMDADVNNFSSYATNRLVPYHLIYPSTFTQTRYCKYGATFGSSYDWVNPQNIQTVPNYAYVYMPSNTSGFRPDDLRAMNFSFNVPTNNIVTGIEVTVSYFTDSGNSDKVKMEGIQLGWLGTARGETKGGVLKMHSYTEEVTYGGPGDLWGVGFLSDPQYVNATNNDFYVEMGFLTDAPYPGGNLYVNWVKMKVYYSALAAPILQRLIQNDYAEWFFCDPVATATSYNIYQSISATTTPGTFSLLQNVTTPLSPQPTGKTGTYGFKYDDMGDEMYHHFKFTAVKDGVESAFSNTMYRFDAAL